MPATLANLLAHVVFSTKHRHPTIRPDWQDALYGYIGGIVRNRRGILLAAGGMPDHVHLLVKYPPRVALSDLVRDVKTNSSLWRHESGDRQFQWQSGYGAFSVSRSGVPAVTDYIARQAEHHRGQTFQEEFLEFLKKNEMEYDLRYLWD